MSTSEDEVARIRRHGALALDSIFRDDRSLSHYGVKGMRWGVRKDDETGKGRDATTEKWKKAHKPKKEPSAKQGKRNLVANEKKSLAKLDGGDPKQSKKTFIARHKKALISAGVVAGVVGGIYLRSVLGSPEQIGSVEKRIPASETQLPPKPVLAPKPTKSKEDLLLESVKNYRGKPISPDDFQKHVALSKSNTWRKQDHIHQSSWDREEFTIPEGHEFYRLSGVAEKEFWDTTYATHSQADFNRYLTAFKSELSVEGSGAPLHRVTFRSVGPLRVPKLSTVLESLRESLIDGEEGAEHLYSRERVLSEYQELSGGSWTDYRAEGMFESLRKKGYGAMVDEMDAGVIGETPIVIFARELMGKKTSDPVTQSDIDFAEANLVELENRKY